MFCEDHGSANGNVQGPDNFSLQRFAISHTREDVSRESYSIDHKLSHDCERWSRSRQDTSGDSGSSSGKTRLTSRPICMDFLEDCKTVEQLMLVREDDRDLNLECGRPPPMHAASFPSEQRVFGSVDPGYSPTRRRLRRAATSIMEGVSISAGALGVVLILNFNQESRGTCPLPGSDDRWLMALLPFISSKLPQSLICPSIPQYLGGIASYFAAGLYQLTRQHRYWADCALVAVVASTLTGAWLGRDALIDSLVFCGFLSLVFSRILEKTRTRKWSPDKWPQRWTKGHSRKVVQCQKCAAWMINQPQRRRSRIEEAMGQSMLVGIGRMREGSVEPIMQWLAVWLQADT